MVDNMKSQSKQLGKMYFTVAAILFGAQILFGLIAGTQFVYSGFLFELLDFNVARMVHINALVVWLLYAMIGSVYYLLPDETKIETVGIGLGKLGFYVLTLAVTQAADLCQKRLSVHTDTFLDIATFPLFY